MKGKSEMEVLFSQPSPCSIHLGNEQKTIENSRHSRHVSMT